ncbi:MAG: hypothetical protein Q4D62_13470 [Planctomycetia bacterium]|nr:hypothetical protein [Planctomycetia bacterium]
MSQEYDTLEEYADISYTGIVGGVLGWLSPLALFSTFFWGIPVVSGLLSSFGLIRSAWRKRETTGLRLAWSGLVLSLIFGTAGVVNVATYRYWEIDAGKYFAQQWLQLLLDGRDLEAVQLSHPTLQRARGAGLTYRYGQTPSYQEEYQNFRNSPAVKVVQRDFLGGKCRYIRCVSWTKMKKATMYTYIFEVSQGEGNMRKSRNIQLTVVVTPVESERTYDWMWRSAEPLP